jgi:hypothetical protein
VQIRNAINHCSNFNSKQQQSIKSAVVKFIDEISAVNRHLFEFIHFIDKRLRESLTLTDSDDEWMKPSLGMSVIVVGNDLYFVIKHDCVFTVPFINAIQYFETIR